MTPTLSELKAWYAKHAKEIQNDFFTYLKFPSISTDPQYKNEIGRTSQWLRDYLTRIGLKVEIWETINHPVIYAEHLEAGSGRPTVLLYSHYDVQPVDPLDKWKSPPFEPVIRDGEVYARGASDDKGQGFYSITAIKAFLELAKKSNVNIKLFIEGEEECGSVGSTHILSKKKEKLKADHLLIVDMGIPAKGVPAITLGLRGICALEVNCKNSDIDLHSGIMGGVVLNPNRILVQALAKLWDETGKVAIPNFYDEVEMPSKDELAHFDRTVDEAALKKNFGIRAFYKEGNYSLWDSNYIRPVLEINGISGGYTGHGFKTVIPSQAFAKISCRLTPKQIPEVMCKRIEDFLKQHIPKGVEVKVVLDHGGKPVRNSPNTPVAKIAAKAYEEVFGSRCQNMLTGGSVPIVADLTAASGAEVAMIGVGLSTDDIHAPNEHFGMDRFEQGFLVIGLILGEFSKL